MDERTRKLKADGNKLFSDIKDLHDLWQEVALHFYPSLADITTMRSLGEDYAEHLTTSYPIIARRTLGDSISAMLRPASLDTTSPGVWFSMKTTDDDRLDTTDRQWLEWATERQRAAMYYKPSNFTRATKEGDHQFVTFGHCPLSVEMNRDRTALLYRCWHVRDVVWQEDAEQKICMYVRKWKPTAQQLYNSFGDKVFADVKKKAEETPYATVECMHIVMRADMYTERDRDNKRWNTPWISIWIDCSHDHLMEEVGSPDEIYVIPRWMTLPQSQYAYSPAVVAALPDARLIQAMTLTLLEAGERYADPPMIGTQEVIRSDVQLYAGGFTWVDYEYDERLGPSMRPAYDVKSGEGLRYGIEMNDRIQMALGKAFFLDSLSLPPSDVREMTAFETAQRISEWIRRAMPIFEPIEFEYNGTLCERTFEIMLRNGGFGSVADMPQGLRGTDLQFKFESPLHESADRRLGQKFLEAKAALMEAAELDQNVVPMLDAKTALRDTLAGIGVPSDWTLEDQKLARVAQEVAAERQAAEQAEQMPQVAQGAAGLGQAAKSFAEAQQISGELVQ